MPEPSSKRCRSCETTRPSSEFGKDRSRKDGLNARCRGCDREAYAKRIGREPSRRNAPRIGGYMVGATCRVKICMDCGNVMPGSPGRGKQARCEDCKPQCEICGCRYRPRHNKGTVQRTCSRECGAWLSNGWTGQTCDVGWASCATCHEICERTATGDPKPCCSPPSFDLSIAIWRRCPECVRWFHVDRGRRFCTPTHAERYYRRHNPKRQQEKRCRRRKVAARGPSFTLAQIVRRDDGICHLCNEPVGQYGNGDWAPSIDHLIPISEGGPDALDNVALAHRWCNSVRHTRSVGEARQLLAA
jgi:hypothetical protein